MCVHQERDFYTLALTPQVICHTCKEKSDANQNVTPQHVEHLQLRFKQGITLHEHPLNTSFRNIFTAC